MVVQKVDWKVVLTVYYWVGWMVWMRMDAASVDLKADGTAD